MKDRDKRKKQERKKKSENKSQIGGDRKRVMG